MNIYTSISYLAHIMLDKIIQNVLYMLVSMIAKKADGIKLGKSEVKTLNELAISNKEDSALTQMRYIKTAFEESEYLKLLHKMLYSSHKPNANTDLLSAIANVSTPRRHHMGVKSIITYNFDNLLEQQFGNLAHNVVYREQDEQIGRAHV